MQTIQYQGYKQQLSLFKVRIKFNRFSLRVMSWQSSHACHIIQELRCPPLFLVLGYFPTNDVILAHSDTLFRSESNTSIKPKENIFYTQ